MSGTVRKAIVTTKPHYMLLHSQEFTIKNKLSSDIASKTLTTAIGRQLFLFPGSSLFSTTKYEPPK